MNKRQQIKLIQDYISFFGKANVILLSTLDEFFGAPLSTNEKVVLQVLDDEPISITEISTRTGLLLTTLTNVIDKMEDKRLVRRRPSRTDRRVVNIELGMAGRQVKTKFDQLTAQISATFMGFLSEEDRNDVADTLNKIVQVLNAEADRVQDTFGNLIEPLKSILASQFNPKED